MAHFPAQIEYLLMRSKRALSGGPPRVYLLIRSLGCGGAERQLVALARGLAARGYAVTVGTLYDGGALRRELVDVPGVRLESFHKSSRWDPRFLGRLARSLARAKPDIIHGYMSPANEIGVAAARIMGVRSVCGLRTSNVDLDHYDWLASVLFRVGMVASRFADAVIANSHSGRDYHVARGYDGSHTVVIANGIDCERFRPNPAARAAIRAAWQVESEERLVGVVARIDPIKDHATFLRAAAQIKARVGVRFVCVGGGDAALTDSLRALSTQLGLTDRVTWVGARDDIERVYNALDILVLSSAFGEGFPNVVAEAMASGRPCVVTAVGDAAVVVGNTGLVVPPANAGALARAIDTLATLDDTELARRGAAARQRIVERFSHRRLIESTCLLFESLSADTEIRGQALET